MGRPRYTEFRTLPLDRLLESRSAGDLFGKTGILAELTKQFIKLNGLADNRRKFRRLSEGGRPLSLFIVMEQSPILWADASKSQTCIPPETSMRWPVTQRLSSDSREAIIGPISSGTPVRPSAVTLAIMRCASGLA